MALKYWRSYIRLILINRVISAATASLVIVVAEVQLSSGLDENGIYIRKYHLNMDISNLSVLQERLFCKFKKNGLLICMEVSMHTLMLYHRHESLVWLLLPTVDWWVGWVYTNAVCVYIQHCMSYKHVFNTRMLCFSWIEIIHLMLLGCIFFYGFMPFSVAIML